MSDPVIETSVGAAPAAPAMRRYEPAIGPRLMKVLAIVFGLFALLAVNSTYLASITFMEWVSGQTYQNWFYLNMFLVHLVLGLLIVVPVIAFGVGHISNTLRPPQSAGGQGGLRAVRHRPACCSPRASC